MRAILVASVLTLVLVPTAAAMSAEQEAHAEADMVSAESKLGARINDSFEWASLFQFQTGSGAEIDPTRSASSSGLEAILAFLAGLTVTAPAIEPAVETAAATYEEGARAEAETEATPTEIAVRAEAGGAGFFVAEEETVEAPAAIPEQSGWSGPAPQAADSEEEAPAPEAPPAVDPQTGSDVAAQGAAEVAPFPVSLPLAAAATLAVATVSGGAGLILVPGWRTALVKLLKKFGILALFSRIAQEDILNHERRAELLEYVRNSPGERIETARRALGFSNGSMHYHLRVLSARDLVRIHREGMVARLFPAGPKIQPAPYVPTIRRKYLEAVNVRPGITQRELAATMGVSERMVSYHVGTLAQQGFVSIRQDGGRKRLFVQQALA